MIRNFLESCDYEHGYRQAIEDVKNWFTNHSQSMKMWKCGTLRDVVSLLSLFKKEPEALMKLGEDLEVNFKREGKKLVFFIPTDESEKCCK